MRGLTSRGHTVELVEHRDVTDRDGAAFHQFTFAVDGRLTKPWEVPKSHRLRYRSDEEFEDYLARSAVSFSQSQWNLERVAT